MAAHCLIVVNMLGVDNFRGQNESRKFFSKVNEDRRGFKPRMIQCKKKDGSLVSDKASILDTWAEHFDNLLNAEDQEGIRPVRLLHLHGDVEPP